MPALVYSHVLCGLLTILAAAPPTRLPVPSDKEQKEATDLVADLYKKEYASAKTPDQIVALAKKLLTEGTGTKDDPAAKFVLLRISRDMAAQQGELPLAFEAIDQLAATFDVDPLALKSDATTTAGKATRRSPAAGNIVPALEALIDQALATDRYDVAKKFMGLATTQARAAKDVAQVKRLTARTKEIDEREKQFAKVKDSLAVLEAKPLDPEANQAVGWFQCTVKGDWAKGITMLALGSDKEKAAIAKAELGEKPIPLELGDAWWRMADGSEGPAKTRIQAHAVAWYRTALPTLTGVTKTKVLKRIGERYAGTQVPKAANGLYQQAIDCAKGLHEYQMGEKFDIAKSWIVYAEAKIPSFEADRHIFVMYGDDRGGLDPILFFLEGKTLIGAVDNLQGKTNIIGAEMPATAPGNWTKVEFVHRADESVFQIYVNDTLLVDSVYNFKLGIDRAMPVRIGGAGGDSQRFRGELRNLVITNF